MIFHEFLLEKENTTPGDDRIVYKQIKNSTKRVKQLMYHLISSFRYSGVIFTASKTS